MSMQGALKISEGSNLAIHALSYLAAVPRGRVTSVARMAEVLNVSRDHLGKVMQRLTRVGLVTSRRGPRGGFALAKKPKEVTLLQIVEAIDGPMAAPGCLLGKPVCEPGNCTLNSLAAKIHKQVLKVLTRTRLSDLPPPVHAG
jgi:Rrf2 family protein